MSPLILYGVISFTLALVFYTTGVWSERRARRLKTWHVVAFFLGASAGLWLTAEVP